MADNGQATVHVLRWEPPSQDWLPGLRESMHRLRKIRALQRCLPNGKETPEYIRGLSPHHTLTG